MPEVDGGDVITIDTKALDKLQKALSKDIPSIRIGILGNKNSRSGKANSNATVGASHEFGTARLPQRSFLRVPLDEHLGEYVEKATGFDEDALKEVIRSGSVLAWMKRIAVIAETVVMDAFKTGGFGKWAPWKSKHYENNTGQVLVDTQQLRNSITSEVK